MLIDYNRVYLDRVSIRIAFMCIHVLLHLIGSYFWYYRTVLVLTKMRAKTTLITLLKGHRSSHLGEIYEMDVKLTSRQFELVCVFGSLIISSLAQYIYYAYYDINDEQRVQFKTNGITNLPIFSANRYVTSRAAMSATTSNKDDANLSSAIDGFKQKRSSSISSWIESSMITTTSTSSSSGIFNPNVNHKQIDCSTCCTSIDGYVLIFKITRYRIKKF